MRAVLDSSLLPTLQTLLAMSFCVNLCILLLRGQEEFIKYFIFTIFNHLLLVGSLCVVNKEWKKSQLQVWEFRGDLFFWVGRMLVALFSSFH